MIAIIAWRSFAISAFNFLLRSSSSWKAPGTMSTDLRVAQLALDVCREHLEERREAVRRIGELEAHERGR